MQFQRRIDRFTFQVFLSWQIFVNQKSQEFIFPGEFISMLNIQTWLYSLCSFGPHLSQLINSLLDHLYSGPTCLEFLKVSSNCYLEYRQHDQAG